ncbi:MAG TPA: cell division protein FtsQ/DivIB [Acetobacteraceae bacterium]|jgi:cell division protein FtsQ
MPRVTRNSLKERPNPLRLLLRRQKKLLRPAAYLAGATVVFMLAVVMLHSAAPGSTLETFHQRIGSLTAFAGLRVQHVDIEGRQNTPEPLLRAALGVDKGAPILGVSLAAARKRIESLSWVKSAIVERRLPGTIVIKLEERRPFAIWQNNGKFMLIDRNGNVVAHQNIADFRKLPLVVGPGAPQAAAALLDTLSALPALQARVAAAIRVGDRRWDLQMTNRTDVMLPEGHEAAALDRLMQLQQSHDVLDRPLVAIDLRLPDRLVLRPHAAPPTDATKKPT